jgi:H+/Cl- antiporter ClcA
MAVFGFKVEPKNTILEEFVEQTKIRMQDTNLVKNPFSANIRIVGDKLVVSMQPIYPNFSLFGWVYILGIYLVWGLTFWLIPGIILGLLGIFWNKWFYVIMLKIALRRKKYKGKLKYVGNGIILKEVVLDGIV